MKICHNFKTYLHYQPTYGEIHTNKKDKDSNAINCVCGWEFRCGASFSQTLLGLNVWKRLLENKIPHFLWLDDISWY